jgi:UDP-glucose 4-epimerase
VVPDYIYLDDMVDGIVRAVKTSGPNWIFNIGSHLAVSINQIIEFICEVTERTKWVERRGGGHL